MSTTGSDNGVVVGVGIDLSGDYPVQNQLDTDGYLLIGSSTDNPRSGLPSSSDNALECTGGDGTLDLKFGSALKGTSGYVLTGNGSSLPPTYQPATGGGSVDSVSGTADRITSTEGTDPVIDIAATYVGQTSITTLGTISTGTWNGTDIAVADGGTGASTLTGVLTGNGTSAVTGNAITEGGVLLGGASNAVSSTGVLAKGVILVGDGSGAPTELTVGTNDYVLTADSAQASGLKWAAGGSGGGDWTLIASATAATSATIDFTGLSSTYNTYCITISDYLPSDDDKRLSLITSSDNGSNWDVGATDYAWNTMRYYQTIESETGVTGAANIRFGYHVDPQGNGANEKANWIVNLFNPSSTSYTNITYSGTYYGHTAGLYYSSIGTGVRMSNSPVNAIRFFSESGNMAVGNFRLYGLSNA